MMGTGREKEVHTLLKRLFERCGNDGRAGGVFLDVVRVWLSRTQARGRACDARGGGRVECCSTWVVRVALARA